MLETHTMIIAGRLVSPERVSAGQIRVSGEKIFEVGANLGRPDLEFSDDCLIFAGMGDIHIHARDDVSEHETYKEDFRTAGGGRPAWRRRSGRRHAE